MMCSQLSSKVTSSGTSGSEIRPCLCASKSPRARDIARPPESMTNREGSLGPGLGQTCPPTDSMRASSSSRSGLWLSPNCFTSQPSPGFFLPYTMAESPTKAERRHQPPSAAAGERQASEQVVPEALATSAICDLRESATSSNAPLTLSAQSSFGPRLGRKRFRTHFGTCSCAKCETLCPLGPCPSMTPKTSQSFLAITQKSSWLGELGFCPRWQWTPSMCGRLLKLLKLSMLMGLSLK
mmetsp:Transcript_71046/g.183209  ORF Transcript_71046/g.183209 Transcript_71046/m.183209 type:complete len:239 (+) Transcript_71046:291-1007(+)